MSRDTSDHINGDYWLDKRRDGASPHIWQATSYKPGSRNIVYRSTKCRDLDDAKAWLDAYVDEQKAKRRQPVDEAKLAPALLTYWKEHGKNAERPDSIACSIRLFLGFLMQDEAGVDLTIAEADRSLFARFIAWRLGPHEYSVPWGGKTYSGKSAGVKGETVQSDLARVAAAFNHQVEYGRIAIAPKVPSVDPRLRSDARDYRYTMDQMGAIMAVAAYDIQMFRYLALQAATMVRPVAALYFDPRHQFDEAAGLIDLHPRGRPRTKKRNPVVPAIPEIVPLLKQWALDGPEIVKSRKRAWRTIRRVLDLPPQAEAKTLRYTIATMMRNEYRVDHEEIEMVLGHTVLKGVSARYAKYDPRYLHEAHSALSSIFQRIMIAAWEWGVVHSLSKTGNDKTIAIDRDSAEAQNTVGFGGAAYRTRTCDPRITNAGKGQRTANPRGKHPERSGSK